METCGANGEDIAEQLTSNDDIQTFSKACICCGQNCMLSAFWEICPKTDPSLLGVDEIYASLIANDDNWLNCAEDMDAFRCDNKLGFTPPGGNKSAIFYEPGKLPRNGTKTTSNIAGAITSPVSGKVYTWTYNGIERPITVAKADANPTVNPSAKASDGSGNDDDDDDDDDGNTDSDALGDEEEDTASLMVP
ncbi:hypothetical protein QQZ08_008732 [Neonectria magnoliae]|uniref:Uncharacterized protein n=1 Tax=Neonectria magnoliae TaxID=2732573 RepID=A0ABR1HU45_9HYPO